MNIIEDFKENYLWKEYYIVVCEDFIYFPKEIVVTALYCDSEGNITYGVDGLGTFVGDPFKVSKEELYKTFKEAKNEAIRLNNIPENKKFAKAWSKDKNKLNFLNCLESDEIEKQLENLESQE